MQASKGRSGCSPQGFTLSIAPRSGVGLAAFTRSRKSSPGSPEPQASSAMRRKRSRAGTSRTTAPVRGWRSSKLRPAPTASMKASVTATDTLKFPSPGPRLASTKSRMSGWSTRSTAMLAPRRTPPCLMVSVAASKTRMKETGPLATPWVVRTRSPRGRSREKEKPVPPPDWWMRAAHLSASKICSRSSPMGRTKQAAS